MSREYYAPPGEPAYPKPLAIYRDRVRTGRPVAEAKKDLYGEFYHRWNHVRKRDLSRFLRHFDKVVAVANRIAWRRYERAA